MARITKYRLILFLAALCALSCRFALAPVPDPALIAQAPDLEALVRTAASGAPLQIKPGVTVNKPAYDVGMFFYPSVAITLFKPAARSGLALWQWLQLAFLVAGCAVMSMPGVPLRLGGAGVLALVAAVVLSGDHQLESMFGFQPYGYWAPPLAALVTLVWMLALPRLPRRVTLAAALLVGALGEWRADAGLIPTLAVLGLAAVTAVRALAARVVAEQVRLRASASTDAPSDDEAPVTRRGMRVALFCVAFVLIARVPDLAVRATLLAHQLKSGVQHFDHGRAKGHMLWHNLYLSYSADALNPHRISWNDQVGWLHAAEYDAGLAQLPEGGVFTEAHDTALRNLYVRTAFADPALWLRAAAARTAKLCDGIGAPWICLAVSAFLASWLLASLASRSLEAPLSSVGSRSLEAPQPSRASRHLEVPLPSGRIRLSFEGPAAITAWGHGPLCCALVTAAAALPPLLYNASPWYARAATLIVRAMPLLLAAGLAARAARTKLVPLPTPVVDRLVLRAAVRLFAALSAVALVFLACGFAGRALQGRPLVACAPPPATVSELARRFDADPRTLRVDLAAATSTDVSRIVDELVRLHGPVKGGGRIVQYPAESAQGTLRAVAWVRHHVLVAFKCARPWPYNGLVREHGGTLAVEFQGARFWRYELRIPSVMPGDEVLWMLPVSPLQADPLAVKVSLREEGLLPHQPDINLGEIIDLKRTPAWQ